MISGQKMNIQNSKFMKWLVISGAFAMGGSFMFAWVTAWRSNPLLACVGIMVSISILASAVLIGRNITEIFEGYLRDKNKK
jgi:O-antigen/teichoic acid export membrane protein